MFLSPELSLGSSQNILESVPVSQCKPYLEAAFGSGIPTQRADRFAVDTFFEAATAYSTDESLREILFDEQIDAAEKVKAFIPRWLQLTEPVVDAARALDKSVASHLAPYKSGNVTAAHNHDMIFMAGVFHMSTLLASVALDIPHPTQAIPDLVRPLVNKGLHLPGGRADKPLPQTILLIPSLVRAQDIRKVDLLKVKTMTLNKRAQIAAERMITVTAAVQAKQELQLLLDEHS